MRQQSVLALIRAVDAAAPPMSSLREIADYYRTCAERVPVGELIRRLEAGKRPDRRSDETE